MTSLSSLFAHITKLFSSDSLTAVEHFISEASPVIGADLAAFMETLPSAFASLEQAAEKAIELYKDAKGVTISKSLAIGLAQNVFLAKAPDLVAEAEALLK